MLGLGVPELMIVAGVVVLLFGVNKLPRLGGALGESIKNFKKGVKGDVKKIDPKDDDSEQPESNPS